MIAPVKDNFFQHFGSIEPKLAKILNCKNLITFKIDNNKQSITTYINAQDGLVHEFRLGIDSQSIAGQCALKSKIIKANMIGTDSYKCSSKNTKHDTSIDQVLGYRVDSTMALPIYSDNQLVGVLQAINSASSEFDKSDELNAISLTRKLAIHFEKFKTDSSSPYDHLLDSNLISRDTLNSILERAANSQSSPAFLLIREQRLSIEDIGKSLENYYQLPFFAFDPNYKINAELLKRFKPAYLKSKNWLPVAEDKKSVTIAVEDPTDIATLAELESVFNPKEIQLRPGIPEDYFQYLETSRKRSLIDNSSTVQAAIQTTLNLLKDHTQKDNTEIIKLVENIIFQGYERGVSDIHIQTNANNHDADILFRVDGTCEVVGHIPVSLIDNIIARIKIISALNIAEKRLPQDGKATIHIDGHHIELRVATIPNVSGRETAVLRILSSAKPLKLHELDFSERNLLKIRKLAENPHGMFLVVGPTGSGKTTTLHSILNYINIPERVIWTAEDPVEITQVGLQQVQIKPKIGFDFNAALRAFLRADPDVIMIGEIRDKDTAEISIKASLTGHLLFSTLHTNSAAETITRMLDLGTDPFSFADAILGVLSQRLVRRLCGECKTHELATEEELAEIRTLYGEALFNAYIERFKDIHLHHAKGCPACNNTGYRGRMAIHELLVNNDEITHLISSRQTTEALRQAAIDDEMKTLLQDGVEKALAGFIDIRELRRTLGV